MYMLLRSFMPGMAAPTTGASQPCMSVARVRPGDTTVTVQVDSTSRSYVLHVPSTYDGSKPVPLVVDFHGNGRHGQGRIGEFTLPRRDRSEGVVMAFPDGMPGPAGTAWNMGPCCVLTSTTLALQERW